MRKQELMFVIPKQLASSETEIIGEGVIEVLQDGFGFFDHQMQITLLDQMTSMFHRRNPVAFRSVPGTR